MTVPFKAAGVSGAKPFPIVPIQFPDVAGAGNTSEMFGDADYGLSISTKAKDKAAAEAFVTWLTTSQAGQQAVADQLNDVPALKGIEPNFEEINFVASATQEFQDAMFQAAQSTATGKATPEEAANTLQEAAAAAQ